MKRHVEEKELPYFAATLTAYLRESHPELLPVSEEAFQMNDLTDDYEISPSYKNLLLELTGLIQTHIELHGIQ